MSLRRVLVVEPYGIGDLLFVTPSLRALRLIPSVEKVDLLLGSRTEAVVKRNPHVDEIFTVDKDIFHGQSAGQTFRDVYALGKKLRARRYDLLLDFSFRKEYAILSRLFLGIPKAAGFDYKGRGFFHTHKLPIPGGFSGKHAAEFFSDLTEAAGIPVRDRFLEFYPDPDDRSEAQTVLNKKAGKVLKNFWVVSAGGGESWGKDAHFKRWPVAPFADFVNRRAAKYPVEAVVFLGSAKEKELIKDFSGRLKVPAIDLAGEVSLGASAAVMEKAALFIGNDGGLLHLAHALRVPIIGFYGPVAPEVYGPYPASKNAAVVYKENLACRPCYQNFRYNAECVGRECLQALTPEEAEKMLEREKFLQTV